MRFLKSFSFWLQAGFRVSVPGITLVKGIALTFLLAALFTPAMAGGLMDRIDHMRKFARTETLDLDQESLDGTSGSAVRARTGNLLDQVISSVFSFGSMLGASIDSFVKATVGSLLKPSSETWKKDHAAGLELALQGRYAEALPHLESALDLVPPRPVRTRLAVLLDLAECAVNSGDPERAARLLDGIPVASPETRRDPMENNDVDSLTPWTIPVLVIRYFPLESGSSIAEAACLDPEKAGLPDWMTMTLGEAREKTVDLTFQAISTLENGSRYLAYRGTDSSPSLKYEIVDLIERLEPMPQAPCPYYQVASDNWSNRKWIVDYDKLLTSCQIRRYVEEKGVKEVWIWGYHRDDLVIWESNMSSSSGDVSNSVNWSDFGKNDLPVLDSTYTVFTYNITRGLSEVIEDHTHQLEAILRDRDYELFWNRFVGYFPAADRDKLVEEGKIDRARRCGWAHFPPNAVRDYDWDNPDSANSDLLNWTPDGGAFETIDSTAWNGSSLDWFVLWRQTIPGRGNTLTWKGKKLTNWWYFLAHWDTATARDIRLVR